MGKEPPSQDRGSGWQGAGGAGASEAQGEVPGGPEPNEKGRLEGVLKSRGLPSVTVRAPPDPCSVPIPGSVKGLGSLSAPLRHLLEHGGLTPQEVDGEGWRVRRAPRSLELSPAGKWVTQPPWERLLDSSLEKLGFGTSVPLGNRAGPPQRGEHRDGASHTDKGLEALSDPSPEMGRAVASSPTWGRQARGARQLPKIARPHGTLFGTQG